MIKCALVLAAMATSTKVANLHYRLGVERYPKLLGTRVSFLIEVVNFVKYQVGFSDLF